MANRFAAEAYEVGNANMEYDAALDALTIDEGHENALGMEGMDMYQNQLAKLSGNLESMAMAGGGIDFDGDGQVDIDASKPGALMKYSEFVAPGLTVATGISMGPGGDPKCDIPDYAPQANGIIPGYAGHIPRARDKYGGAAHSGCSLESHGVHTHLGPQIAHEKSEALGNRYGNDGLPLPPKAVEPIFDNYKTSVMGVMPGYGGFRPGARDECGGAAYGGVKRFGMAQSRQPYANPKPNFVAESAGVLPGYTGYVPQAKQTHGVSHYGELAGGHHNLAAAGAQKGHGGARGDASIEVQKTVKSGYSGHVPTARDTFGGAHYGVGSHLSPDGYKKAPPKRNLQDMRLITGSDAGNSAYASDGGGGFFGASAHLAEFHNYATDDEAPPSMVGGANAGAIMQMQGIGKKEGMLSY